METILQNIWPILEISDGMILSKEGDVTLGFEIVLPEIFTLSSDDYENIHQTWIKAIKVLPQRIIFHKQDWFCKKLFRPATVEKKSFLQSCSDRFFNGRKFLDHKCYVFLTRIPNGKKLSTSATNNLMRRSLVQKELKSGELVAELSDASGQFARILQDSGYFKLERLTDRELKSNKEKTGLIERYTYLADDEQPLSKDLSFKDGIQIGDRHGLLFTFSDPSEFPTHCGPRIDYDKYSTDKTGYSISFAGHLGLLCPCNHIYNQFLFIEDPRKAIKQLEGRRLRLQSLSAYSRENLVARDAVNDFLNDNAANQRIPVKAHFNVLTWSDDREELRNLKNLVSSSLSQIDLVPKIETDGAPQIFWSGIPGNEAAFPVNETFDVFLEQAACFLNIESNYRSDQGINTIRFGERLSGRPMNIDLFDQPMNNGMITNRGMFVCGSSGGGKSMLCNHILRTLHDQGAHVVVVDIGGSYKGLSEMLNGYYFTYKEEKPICFNPFYLAPGESLDTEKKESLKALLATLWKQEHETFNRSEYVALSNALQGFYKMLADRHRIFPCFNSFYEWLAGEYVNVLKSHKVKERDFDVENFLYVLRPYYKGGEFDYLLNAEQNLDLLNERFIVFELDNIKDHPILFPVVTLVIMELFISKTRKIPTILKALAIEEAWKAMAKSGMAEFMRYGFKTLRKLYGIPIVVTQEIDDLVSSPIIRDAIIGNSDIKILMDMRKFINKFEGLQATLGMSEKGKVQLFSVNRANEPQRKYREFYLDLGGNKTMVLRNELSPEEYLTYTTEQTEKQKVLEYANKFGSYQKAIEFLALESKKGTT